MDEKSVEELAERVQKLEYVVAHLFNAIQASSNMNFSAVQAVVAGNDSERSKPLKDDVAKSADELDKALKAAAALIWADENE